VQRYILINLSRPQNEGMFCCRGLKIGELGLKRWYCMCRPCKSL